MSNRTKARDSLGQAMLRFVDRGSPEESFQEAATRPRSRLGLICGCALVVTRQTLR